MPSHAWNRWRYHYPQAAFPYEDLIDENGRRGKLDPEYELLDTGAFDDDRYWIVDVHYAKADPMRRADAVRVTNAGPDAETLHVLPTAWFRNTWSWDVGALEAASMRPVAPATCARSTTRSWASSSCWPAPARTASPPDAAVLRERDQHRAPVRRDLRHAVPEGRHQRPRRSAALPTVNPDQRGTKCAFWYQADGRAGRDRRAAAAAASGELRADARGTRPGGRRFDTVVRPAPGARPTSSTPS